MKHKLIASLMTLMIAGCSGLFKINGSMFCESFDVLRYHILGENLIIEFHEEAINSAFIFGDPKITFNTNQIPRSVELEFTQYLSNDYVKSTINHIKNGNLSFTIHFPKFDPEIDKLFIRDDNGLHEIPFEGFRDKPFEPFIPEEIPLSIDLSK